MLERVKRIDNFEKSAQMKIIRRKEDSAEIDEQRPFLDRSVPVTRSPKVTGAGVQLSNRVYNAARWKQLEPPFLALLTRPQKALSLSSSVKTSAF